MKVSLEHSRFLQEMRLKLRKMDICLKEDRAYARTVLKKIQKGLDKQKKLECGLAEVRSLLKKRLP